MPSLNTNTSRAEKAARQKGGKAPPIHPDTINQARSTPIGSIIDNRGIKLRGGVEREGPCPVCGGQDRFAINTKKNIWNCRGCEKGGDPITLVQHLDEIDFRGAC